MPKLNNKDAHAKIDKAILDSVQETAGTVTQIAKETGEYKSLVHRRFYVLGFEYVEGRWVWRGSKRTKVSSE